VDTIFSASDLDDDNKSDSNTSDNDNNNNNNVVDNEPDPDFNNTVETSDDNNNEEQGVADTQPAIEQSMDTQYGRQGEEHNLRPHRPRDYGHLHATLAGIILSQHSMKQGIKLFGQDGVDAEQAELSQLRDRSILNPKDAGQLTRAQKKAALEYLMFIKKKRCGRIKGRGCADGRKQREYTSKEEASSPTVSIEALMLLCVINATEKRDVATVDIPGAFMQANMDKLVHMRLEGTMAELVVKLDPKLYRKYMQTINGKLVLCVELKKALMQTINGKSVLCVELKKALYGTMHAALLFWRLLTSKLVAMGFKINPYDWCVANKTINGKQCTILWHVDDL
jgi:hypothetical protein